MLPNKLVIGFVAAIVIIGGTYFFAYRSGVAATVSEYNEKILSMQSELNKAKGKLAKAGIKREVIYRDKIKTVVKTVDVCADTVVAPDILRSIRGSRTGRKPNG